MKKKLILIIAVIALVLAGILMMNNSSSDNKTNTDNDQTTTDNNTNTDTNTDTDSNTDTSDKTDTSTNAHIDSDAKATYDAVVQKINTEVYYLVSEYDMAGTLVECETFKADEHVVSVERVLDGPDGYIYGVDFSYKDKNYYVSLDDSFNYTYVEEETEESYTNVMYSDFFSNPSANVKSLTQSKEDGKTIIRIEATLEIEDTTQYLVYLVTVNKEGLVDQEEMIVTDENFEYDDDSYGAVVEFHSYNKKDKNAFKSYVDIMKSCDGKSIIDASDTLRK